MMELRSLSSCSVNEIANLGYGRTDGPQLLTEVLTKMRVLTTQLDPQTRKTVPIVSGYIVPTYVWSGVVKGRANGGAETICSHYPFNGYTLAMYINSLDIGKCGMSEPQPNAYHSGDRLTQAFVWAPDITKIKDLVENGGIKA